LGRDNTQAVIPIDPADPGGAAITLDETHFRVLGDRGDVIVIKELMLNWELTQSNQPPGKIEPLA